MAELPAAVAAELGLDEPFFVVINFFNRLNVFFINLMTEVSHR